jgi:large repetitive protein
MRINLRSRLRNSETFVDKVMDTSGHSRSIWLHMILRLLAFPLGILIGLSTCFNPLAFAGSITYAYDPLGRLVATVNGSGNAATYQYDNVGNLRSISTTNSSQVSIFALSPNKGRVNISVTIYGDGFSTTPSQNTVTFAGQAATVTSSTQTTIATTVPTGAVTGNVTVTAPAGSATASFTVTQ